jgi:hypothetical protein
LSVNGRGRRPLCRELLSSYVTSSSKAIVSTG